jgi:radical SAM protein with 4Fe4S-binding SPASM domain
MGTYTSGSRPGGDPRDDGFFLRHGFTAFPRLVQWMITGECAWACDHCMTAPGQRQRSLTLEQAALLLDEVAALGVDELLLTGGEPLQRPDLPEILRALRERRIRWSLNTARAPRGEVLRAMESWPPCFAAVSLDGPLALHDRIRGVPGAHAEALEAIRILADLTGGHVTAGTTVSRRNLGALPETFAIAAGSGASAWGLHLVVPEGRAVGRADLFLRTDELEGLIRFAAAKRAYFPVTMADELGYCGAWEPLVRDRPFFCGAGRTQCVILPDGGVTACTTFDPRMRQGSILERSLADLWAMGFSQLRRGAPDPDCAACTYVAACKGGCWLQRRHRVHCRRPAWEPSSGLAALGTVAGLAVCLGLAACTPAAPVPGKPTPADPVEGPAEPAREPDQKIGRVVPPRCTSLRRTSPRRTSPPRRSRRRPWEGSLRA